MNSTTQTTQADRRQGERRAYEHATAVMRILELARAEREGDRRIISDRRVNPDRRQQPR